MNSIIRRAPLIAAALTLLLFAVACGAPAASAEPPTSRISREQALQIAENALTAINTGDYAAYSRDWSDTLKAGISQSAFESWRSEVLGSAGSFQSITGAELINGKQPGVVRWVFTASFEKMQASYGLGFKQDGDKIEGVFLEPIK